MTPDPKDLDAVVAADWIRPSWSVSSSVVAFTTSRTCGVSRDSYQAFNLATHTADEPVSVETNRATLARILGTEQVQWLDQVHGSRCVEANISTLHDVPKADAVWTSCGDLALAVLTADCVPILVSDQAGGVIGAAHAGWRGLASEVINALITAMPVPAAQLSAWIGPCISPSRYQVGEDVWRHFTQRYAETMKPSSNNGTNNGAKKLLQLANIAELQLREAGLAVVVHSNVCSYQDPRLYSFRQWTHQNQREKRNPVDTGRMASVIMRQQA